MLQSVAARQTPTSLGPVTLAICPYVVCPYVVHRAEAERSRRVEGTALLEMRVAHVTLLQAASTGFGTAQTGPTRKHPRRRFAVAAPVSKRPVGS
jgi:hypothetical protein